MGYTTEFDGSVSLSPPLNAYEIAYLRKFAASRRMDRTRGPYFVDGSGPFGQGHDGEQGDPLVRARRDPGETHDPRWYGWASRFPNQPAGTRRRVGARVRTTCAGAW